MLLVLCSEDLIVSQLLVIVLNYFFYYCNQLINMKNDNREKFTCPFAKIYALDSNACLLNTQIRRFGRPIVCWVSCVLKL